MFTQFEARHYKCLKQVKIELAPFNILIGPNASGKSTLLDIAGFLQDALQSDVEQAVRNRAPSLSELVWQEKPFQTDSSTPEFELAVNVKIPNTLLRSGYDQVRYEVCIGKDEQEGIVVQRENLWLVNTQQFRNGTAAQPTLFPIEPDDTSSVVHPSHTRTPAGYRLVVRKNYPGNDYFRSETTGWNITFRLSPRRLALSGIPEDQERFPIALWLKSFLLTQIQILQLHSTWMRQPTPADAPQTFQPDGSNLPVIAARLKEIHPQRFEWWVGHLQTILPDLQTIEIFQRPEDRAQYLVVSYKTGLKVPAWLLSDGTLRLLALTLIAYLPPQDHVFLIEEPENGIHPRAIEGVFQALSSVYQGQIFLATHSPLVLALSHPAQLLVFAKTSTGATAVIRGHHHPALRAWKSDLSLDTLFAAGVLE
ncbi:MAG: chromosome segregation protein SMC [Chloroflexi bacterium]|nr:MAG: chromosome segregation protein SMC [Chloroflexota bacterium]